MRNRHGTNDLDPAPNKPKKSEYSDVLQSYIIYNPREGLRPNMAARSRHASGPNPLPTLLEIILHRSCSYWDIAR
ncbi:hypothetical protein N7509_009302 [Penicillium cosmopolitanum]|uniref:Uncharacterized protein n=1 Tax=Penicillium cosmopolitanum TaxID=1131564 RepID=A0A9W9VP53_9EURO|nr:uncharacterized protein N7509_009302 [Penicillium cosmopolitanum]KAJ5386761.1 hypothetical protein N7509_009302 [Penicillium cosmopolitanum]